MGQDELRGCDPRVKRGAPNSSSLPTFLVASEVVARDKRNRTFQRGTPSGRTNRTHTSRSGIALAYALRVVSQT